MKECRDFGGDCNKMLGYCVELCLFNSSSNCETADTEDIANIIFMSGDCIRADAADIAAIKFIVVHKMSHWIFIVYFWCL
jgi:hypothetical protein